VASKRPKPKPTLGPGWSIGHAIHATPGSPAAMLVADEMQRLDDTWPNLPAANDAFVLIPPTHSGHARTVNGSVPILEIVYVANDSGLHFVTLRPR
jgi:hypothetical protein